MLNITTKLTFQLGWYFKTSTQSFVITWVSTKEEEKGTNKHRAKPNPYKKSLITKQKKLIKSRFHCKKNSE